MSHGIKYIVGVNFDFKKCMAWIVPVDRCDSMDYSGEALPLYQDGPELFKIDTLLCERTDIRHLFYGLFIVGSSFPKDIYPFLTSSSSLKKAYSKVIQEIVEMLKSVNPVLNEDACEWCFYIPPFLNSSAQRRFVFFDIISTAMSQEGINVNHFISPLKSIEGKLDNDRYLDKNLKILYISYNADTIDTYLRSGGTITTNNVSNLGASKIEELLFDDLKKNHPDYRYVYENNLRLLDETGNSHYDLDKRILYNLKKKKEDCFGHGSYPRMSLDFNLGLYLGYVGHNNPFKRYPFEYMWDDIEEIIKPYQDKVSQFFQDVKDSCLNDINLVYCVGKPFEMTWVERSLKNIFDCNIRIDRAPSFMPARGTAYYVRNLIKSNNNKSNNNKV